MVKAWMKQWSPIQPFHLPKYKSVLQHTVFNVSMISSFGLIHSVLADQAVHRCLTENKLFQVIPKEMYRSFYIIITGLHLGLCIFLWQPYDHISQRSNDGAYDASRQQSARVYVWDILPTFIGTRTNQKAIDLSIYLIFMCLQVSCMFSHNVIEFLGLDQIYPLHFFTRSRSRYESKNTASQCNDNGSSHLQTTGLYAMCRHPLYLFSLSAMLLTLRMGMTRFILTLSVTGYLYFIGIPHEEKKLVNLFGDAYVQYQQRSWAVLPLFGLFKRVMATFT